MRTRFRCTECGKQAQNQPGTTCEICLSCLGLSSKGAQRRAKKIGTQERTKNKKAK